MDVSLALLLKTFLITNFFFFLVDGFENLGKCGDIHCTALIGEGVTLTNYFADHQSKLSFSPNQNVLIFVKGAFKKEDCLGVVIDGRKGYVPAKFIKETKTLIPKANLVPAQADFLFNTAAPSSTQFSQQWSSNYEHSASEAPHQSPQFQQHSSNAEFSSHLSSSSQVAPPNHQSGNQYGPESSPQWDERSSWDHVPPHSPSTFGGEYTSHQGGEYTSHQGHFAGESSSYTSQNTFGGEVHSNSFGQEHSPMNPPSQEHFHGDQSSQGHFSGDPSSQEHFPGNPSSQQQFPGVSSSQEQFSVVPSSQGHFSGDPSNQQQYPGFPSQGQYHSGSSSYNSLNTFGADVSSSYDASQEHYRTENAYRSSLDQSSYHFGENSEQVQFVTEDGQVLQQNADLFNTLRMLKEQGIVLQEDIYDQSAEGLKSSFEVEPSFITSRAEQLNPAAETRLHSSTPVLDENDIDIEEEEENFEDITRESSEERSESGILNSESLKSELSSSEHEILNSKSGILNSQSQSEFSSSGHEILHSKSGILNSEFSSSGPEILNSKSGIWNSQSQSKLSSSGPEILNSKIESSRPIISNSQFEFRTPQVEIPNSKPDVPHSETVSSRGIEISSSETVSSVISNSQLEVSTPIVGISNSESDPLSSDSENLNSQTVTPTEILNIGHSENAFFAKESEIRSFESKVPQLVSSLSVSDSSNEDSLSEFPKDLEKIFPSNSSESKEGDFFQSRNLKEEIEGEQNQDFEEPTESGFDFSIDHYLEAVRSFVEVLISWLPDPLHSVLLEVGRSGLSPRVPVFTFVSSLPCISLILALCYIKEKSKERKLIALLAQTEKNVYELTAEKNVLEEKIERTSEELKSSSSTLDSERTSYESEVEGLRESVKEKTTELESRLAEVAALRKREEEFARLAADYQREHLELEQKKTQVLELEESISDLNCEIVEKESELESLQKEQLRLLQCVKESEEQLNQLQQNCNQLLKEAEVWNMRVSELTAQMSELSAEKEEKQELLSARDQEIQSLTHLVKTLKSFEEVAEDAESYEEVLKDLLNATSLLIKLEVQEEENKSLSEKLSGEKNKLIEKDVELLEARSECDKLKLSYVQALQDRTEAQTKLDVLTNYFKDKEIQMQKEIGAQEAVRERREKDADSAERRILLVEQENASYKYQVASMKQEIEETERNLKSQIATQEKKAHENWIAARAAERRLEDMKQEMSILKQRLTLLEQEASTARDEVLRPIPKRLSGLTEDPAPGEPPLPPLPFPPMLPLDRPLPPHLLPPHMEPPFRPPWPPRGRETPPRHSSPLSRDSPPPPEFHEGRPPFFPPPPMRFGPPPPPMWAAPRKPDDPRSQHDSWSNRG